MQIKREYQRIQNIRFITFEDRATGKQRSKSPAFATAVKENHAAAATAQAGGGGSGESGAGVSVVRPEAQLHEL